MEFLTVPLLLDGVIALLLVITIAYVVRLTLYLKKFKDSRSELEVVVKTLSAHIEKAEKSIQTLNDAVETSSDDLQHRMNKANAMFDELDLVVQTGDALATRLEDLATRNRGGEGTTFVKSEDSPLPASGSMFSIRDPELESGQITESEGFTLDDDDMLSEAERDLYQALQENKKSRARG